MARRKKQDREKIEVSIPVKILDELEDLSHQADMSRQDFILQTIRIGYPQIADSLGLVLDRPNKVTYKDRE
ncbi:hypothetical protein ACFLYP_03795 [Chloroflexota bacterium]